jgi:hypothetical protein
MVNGLLSLASIAFPNSFFPWAALLSDGSINGYI